VHELKGAVQEPADLVALLDGATDASAPSALRVRRASPGSQAVEIATVLSDSTSSRCSVVSS
jgi:hypothetical protein